MKKFPVTYKHTGSYSTKLSQEVWTVTFDLSKLSSYAETRNNPLKISYKKFQVQKKNFLVPRPIHITYIHFSDNNRFNNLEKYSAPFLLIQLSAIAQRANVGMQQNISEKVLRLPGRSEM